MAKNKGKFGKGKPAVEEVDEFVGTFQRLGERLKPHVVPIAVAVAAIAVMLVGYYTYSWWQGRKERKATTALVKAFAVADRKVSDIEMPKNTDPNVKVVVYKTEKQKAEALLEALDKVPASTSVGKNAQLLRAATLYDLGKYDEAESLYRKVASSGVARTLKRLAREGAGYAREAKADKDKSAQGSQQALEMFRQVQTDEKGAGYDVALFHQGRLLAKLDKKAEAAAAFEKLMKLKPPSIFNNDAERRLAIVKGGDTYPKPAPKKKIKVEKVPDTPEDGTPSVDNKDEPKKDAPAKKDAAKDGKTTPPKAPPAKKSGAKKGDAKK